MATYSTDLRFLQDGAANNSDAESGISWVEMASPYNVGDIPAEGETDYYIQGLGCASTDTNNKTGLASGCIDCGSSQVGLFTDGVTCVFIWHVLLPGNAMDSYANGGLRAIVGSTTSAFGAYYVGGDDKGRNPYGGWQNYALDPSNTPNDTQGGWTPGTAGSGYQYFGAATNLTAAIQKGTMHGWDAMRYGRGQLVAAGADATFVGMAEYNDFNDGTNGYNRFGLFQEQGGTYLWKGLMVLGNSASSVTFSDANRVISVDDTPVTYPTFNRIEIGNATSTVDWTNISFNALGTLSKGQLEVFDDPLVSFDNCSFQNMDTFIFDANCSVTNCTFVNCGVITANEGTFTGTKVLEANVASDTAGFVWDSTLDPQTYLRDMTFSMGANNSHAIEFGANVTSNITLSGMEFTDYNQIEDDPGAALLFTATSGSINVNISGCTVNGATATSSNLFKDDAAGISVTLVFDPITYSINVNDNNGNDLEGASIYLAAEDNTGDLPYRESVSITRTGNACTVIHTSHGLNTNEYVNLSGITNATEDNYGCFQITVSNANAYTYTSNVSGTTTYTGDIRSTGVLLYGYSDANGNISGSRTFALDQNVTGYVRKSTSSPRFKSFSLAGNVIDSVSGLALNVRMVLDE